MSLPWHNKCPNSFTLNGPKFCFFKKEFFFFSFLEEKVFAKLGFFFFPAIWNRIKRKSWCVYFNILWTPEKFMTIIIYYNYYYGVIKLNFIFILFFQRELFFFKGKSLNGKILQVDKLDKKRDFFPSSFSSFYLSFAVDFNRNRQDGWIRVNRKNITWLSRFFFYYPNCFRLVLPNDFNSASRAPMRPFCGGE